MRNKHLKIIKLWVFLLSIQFALVGYRCDETEDGELLQMNVEYDYQNDFWNEDYDVFRAGQDRLENSYSNASTEVFIYPDETSLTPEALTFASIMISLLDHYYYNDWTNGGDGPHHTVYLFGMLDVIPRIPGETAWSLTVHDQGSSWGEPFCSSVIFTGFLADTLSKAPYYWYDHVINAAIDLVVIHELGHARGGFSEHCPNNGEVPCVMVAGLPVDEDHNLHYWHDFCDDCRPYIESVDWDPNW